MHDIVRILFGKTYILQGCHPLFESVRTVRIHGLEYCGTVGFLAVVKINLGIRLAQSLVRGSTTRNYYEECKIGLEPRALFLFLRIGSLFPQIFKGHVGRVRDIIDLQNLVSFTLNFDTN
jgi:hypothetical protein